MVVDDLVAEVQTVVDADSTSALTVLNRRYKQMVVKASAYRDTDTVALVDGQAFYALDSLGFVEIYTFTVGGVPYGRARRDDKYAASLGALVWSSPGGFVVVDASSAGVSGVTLIPTPGTGTLEVYGSKSPADLVGSDNVSTLKIDPDLHEALILGTASTILMRQGEGDPGTLEAQFQQACEELRQRVARRYRGSGPPTIRVVGINA